MNQQVPQPRPLRPLRPLPASTQASSTGQSSVTPPLPATLPKARSSAAAACEACRKRKSRCDAARPICGRCTSKRTTCLYRTNAPDETPLQALKRRMARLEREKTVYEDIYTLLQSRSPAEAEEILARIRSHANPESIIRHIHDGDLLLQLSLVPETRLRYEFPYITSMPAFLCEQYNPYLQSLIYEGISSDVGLPVPPAVQQAPEQVSRSGSPYLKPYHSATIIDETLDAVKPSRWTLVSKDDKLMRKLLKHHFLYDYQWFPLFPKDCFLSDMLSGGRRCCSSLLVNAVLALASTTDISAPNRAEFWNPKSLLYQFFAEAKRLWELEAGKAGITTIQAAMVLNLLHAHCSSDKLGLVYTQQAIGMAHELKLFEPSPHIQDPTLRRARDMTAWQLFLFQSHTCYYFFQPPMIEEPPASPLPDPVLDPGWYGEFWLKYAGDEMIWPSYYNEYLHARLRFHLIINDICRILFNKVDAGNVPSVGTVQRLYRKLGDWYTQLPESLIPRNIFAPSHLKLHIQYFNVLINLFEGASVSQQRDPSTWSASWTEAATPQEILSAAKASMETIIRLYYLRHSFEHADSMIIQCNMVLAGVCMAQLRQLRQADGTEEVPGEKVEALRSSLILAAKGISDQGRFSYLARPILGVLRGDVAAEDDVQVGRFTLKMDDPDAALIESSAVHADYPVYIVSVADNHETKRLRMRVKELSLEPDS